MATKRRNSETLCDLAGFEIAILCALPIESEAVECALDEIYQNKKILWQKVDGDQNAYTLGRIGMLNVVLAHMPHTGKIRAASGASSLKVTFSGIKLALVVGICGGATRTPDQQDIFLGDVIISTQLQQGDFGREYPDGIDLKDAGEGGSRPAPPEVAAFLHQAQTKHSRKALCEDTRDTIDALLPYVEATLPTTESDVLYASNYLHKHHQSCLGSDCAVCNSTNTAICDTAKKSTCRQLGCDTTQRARQRTRHVSTGPRIHFGAITTFDIVKKNGISRDHYTQKHKVLAFEMEAAGVWEIFPTIVVKAVCDYADSHKNKIWQQYAAVSAAACCKNLLRKWVPSIRGTAGLGKILHLPVEQRSAIDDELTRKDYLASLDFEQLDSRYHDIRFAYPKTCDWVFGSHEFQAWLNPDNFEECNRVLWIKGKPESGKSTLIKHIYEVCSKHFSGHVIVAYFFHGRGSELQKTRLGMLRSLLLQLLERREELLQKFIKAFPLRGQSIENQKWVAEELENFLLHCARQGWLKDTVLLVDALDECGESTARGLASFYENLSLNSVTHSGRLLICLSIRHFPNVSINHCIQLDIDRKIEHDLDIGRYVSSTILLKNANLIDQVTRKARHVFSWAVLVVQILNQLYDQGNSLQSMLECLKEVPDSLHNIFKSLVQLDGGLSKKGILIFQLILFAERPLSPQALYLLVMSGYDPGRPWKWDRNDMDDIRLKNWITTESRGLLEVTTPLRNSHKDDFIGDQGFFSSGQIRPSKATGFLDGYSSIVQAIHESVEDFLLNLENVSLLKNGETQFSYSACHKSIVDCCMESMIAGVDASGSVVGLQYPHAMYALEYLPFHIEQAQLTNEDFAHLIKQYADALEGYSWYYPFKAHWPGPPHNDLLLHAILTISERIVDRTKFRKSSERLLTAVLKKRLTIGNNLFGSVLFFVAEQNWPAAMKILIDADANAFIRDTNGRSLIDNVFTMLSIDNVFTMLSLEHSPFAEDSQLSSIETRTSFNDRVEVACILIAAYMQAGYDIPAVEGTGLVPLVIAVKIGSVKLVSYLLRAGADPNTAQGRLITKTGRQTPLAIALALCADRQCATNSSIRKRYKDIVFMLLEHNANWIDTSEEARNLFDILAYGDRQLVEMLLNHGMIPRDGYLGEAYSKHYFKIAELLLTYGAGPSTMKPPLLHS